jgi:hypothetical protein
MSGATVAGAESASKVGYGRPAVLPQGLVRAPRSIVPREPSIGDGAAVRLRTHSSASRRRAGSTREDAGARGVHTAGQARRRARALQTVMEARQHHQWHSTPAPPMRRALGRGAWQLGLPGARRLVPSYYAVNMRIDVRLAAIDGERTHTDLRGGAAAHHPTDPGTKTASSVGPLDCGAVVRGPGTYVRRPPEHTDPTSPNHWTIAPTVERAHPVFPRRTKVRLHDTAHPPRGGAAKPRDSYTESAGLPNGDEYCPSGPEPDGSRSTRQSRSCLSGGAFATCWRQQSWPLFSSALPYRSITRQAPRHNSPFRPGAAPHPLVW